MDAGADLVIVGAGTVGGWAAAMAAQEGARVVVLERGLAGMGASGRAAGIVRAQGGTPTAVRLGSWSIDFYRRQAAEFGTDSGFRPLGYLLLALDEAEAQAARERVAMQRDLGLDVTWLDPAQARAASPTLAAHGYLGASHAPGDGAIDPARNVRAYSLAMQRAGVDLRERTPALELVTDGGRVTGVRTPDGVVGADRVLLTGGPGLAALGRLAGVRVPVGGVRHQVAVTEPHPILGDPDLPMGFDIGMGLYWREEEGGLLFGMSNPRERPGEATSVDTAYLEAMRKRLAGFLPAAAGLRLRKVWAATIDYTPDHLPILGPARDHAGRGVDGVTLAAPAGHGMMWGPAVARAAADLALTGRTGIVDVTDLGLDRFDAAGRSRVAAEPVALPFPVDAGEVSSPTAAP